MFAVSEQEYLLSKCYFTEQRITNKHETRFLLILWKKKLCTDILKSTVTRVPFIWRLWPQWYVQRTMHCHGIFLGSTIFFLKKKNVVKQCFFFTITTRYHTNPYNPSKSTSVVSWRLPDTAVLLPGLGSISKMLSSLTLYQFYILHCVYIEGKKDKGEEKIMASCIRGGEIKRRSSRSLSKFRLTLHPLSLIP